LTLRHVTNNYCGVERLRKLTGQMHKHEVECRFIWMLRRRHWGCAFNTTLVWTSS